MPPGALDLVEYLVRCAPTGAEALALGLRYLNILDELAEAELVAGDGPDEVCLRVVVDSPIPHEACFAAVVGQARLLIGDFRPLAVEFTHHPEGGIEAYERFFDAPVRFGAGTTRLVLSRASLAPRRSARSRPRPGSRPTTSRGWRRSRSMARPAAWPGRRRARGPICQSSARVGSTTYYSCSGSYHGALDMSNGTCNEWNHRGMILGYRYDGGCGKTCGGSSCNGGAGNYVVVSGSSGWQFRQLHIGANASSGSKTCDRCALGPVSSTGHSTGAHVHADNRRHGTRMTAWYTSVGTTCGRSACCGNVVGKPTL